MIGQVTRCRLCGRRTIGSFCLRCKPYAEAIKARYEAENTVKEIEG